MSPTPIRFDKVYSQLWELNETSRDLLNLKEVMLRESVELSGNFIHDGEIDRKLQRVTTQFNDIFDNYMKQMEDIANAYITELEARKRVSTLQELAMGVPADAKVADAKLKKKRDPREAEEDMRRLAMAYARKEDIKEEEDDEQDASRLSSPLKSVSIHTDGDNKEATQTSQKASLNKFIRRVKSYSFRPDSPEDQTRKLKRVSGRIASNGSKRSEVRQTMTTSGHLMALR